MKQILIMVVLFATTLPIAGCIVAPYPVYGYGYRHHGCGFYRCW